MPMRMVDDGTHSVGKYDVCAKYGTEHRLLVHAFLCNEDDARKIDRDRRDVRGLHMGPPLGVSTTQADTIGSADLTDAERRQIKSFVDERLSESKAHRKRLLALENETLRDHLVAEYVICPAAKPPDRDFPLWRFNCAGFVIKAYEEADIEILVEEIPRVTLEDLKQAYQHESMRLDDAEFREQMGIGDGTSWPVVLVGYVAHSFNRSAAEIRNSPYQPEPGDEYFPRIETTD